jgi:hypothetical protein
VDTPTLTLGFYSCGHRNEIPYTEASYAQHISVEQYSYACPDCQMRAVYLIARHDGKGTQNNVEPYLGFGWRILVPGKEILPGLVILQGPPEHALWQAQRLDSGMLLRYEPGPIEQAIYHSPEEADDAVATNGLWWIHY